MQKFSFFPQMKWNVKIQERNLVNRSIISLHQPLDTFLGGFA